MSRDKERIRGQLLVVRHQRGDPAALPELIQAWEKRLFYYIRRLVDQEADAWDVLQKTWLKVVDGLKSLKDSRSLACWLYTVARNTAIDHQRASHRFAPPQSLQSAEVEEPACMAQESELEMENAESIHQALGKLSVDHREVLTMFFLQDLSLNETAAVVGVGVGTVKSRLHYARQALRRALEEAK